MVGVLVIYAQRVAAALLLAAALAACQAPPSVDRLKADLEAILADAPPGLLSVQDVAMDRVERSGSQRTVNFITHLRVNRDHAFSAWDQFNAPTLARMLGANAAEVHGINPRLNGIGDTLTVPGRAVYDPAPKNEGWVLTRLGPPRPTDLKRLRIRDQAWDVVQMLLTVPETWRTVRENLAWAISRSRGQLARLRGGYALAGGPVGSDGWSIIEALRRNDEARRPVVNLAMPDDAGLLSMLRDGAATAAILDSDRIATAEIANLRAVAALYPKPVHVLVPANSTVASIADLRGKRIGHSNVPNRAGEDVLRAHRLPATTLAALVPMNLTEALDALGSNRLDALVVSARAPDERIAGAIGAHSFRLLSLDSDAIALLTTGEDRYAAVKIPGRIYAGQPNPVTTIAVIATLIAPQTVPPDEIAALVKSLFGPVDYLGYGSVAGAFISTATAQHGLNLPLHSGADAYFHTLAGVH